MKGAVLRRGGYRCQDCGEEFGKRRRKHFDPTLRRGRGGYRWESLEVHHIIPRGDGGSDHPGNLKTLCPPCHAGYTRKQAVARAAVRRERTATLRALERGLGDEEYIDDPRD
jgi:5-methylcytosine-specific restriction protein A